MKIELNKGEADVVASISKAYTKVAVELGCKEYSISTHAFERDGWWGARYMLSMHMGALVVHFSLVIKARNVGPLRVSISQYGTADDLYVAEYFVNDLSNVVADTRLAIVREKGRLAAGEEND